MKLEIKYENDAQIVEDAATKFLETHLQWSNSLDSKPSENKNVKTDILMALVDAAGRWENVTEEDKEQMTAKAEELFAEASKIADGKWEAMMTLLGI